MTYHEGPFGSKALSGIEPWRSYEVEAVSERCHPADIAPRRMATRTSAINASSVQLVNFTHRKLRQVRSCSAHLSCFGHTWVGIGGTHRPSNHVGAQQFAGWFTPSSVLALNGLSAVYCEGTQLACVRQPFKSPNAQSATGRWVVLPSATGPETLSGNHVATVTFKLLHHFCRCLREPSNLPTADTKTPPSRLQEGFTPGPIDTDGDVSAGLLSNLSDCGWHLEGDKWPQLRS